MILSFFHYLQYKHTSSLPGGDATPPSSHGHESTSPGASVAPETSFSVEPAPVRPRPVTGRGRAHVRGQGAIPWRSLRGRRARRGKPPSLGVKIGVTVGSGVGTRPYPTIGQSSSDPAPPTLTTPPSRGGGRTW